MAYSKITIQAMIGGAQSVPMEHGDDAMYSARDVCELVRYFTGEYPKEIQKSEIINPSAREMIEAEMEVIKKQCEIDGHPAAKIARKGALYIGNFALKCFDKPSEPMEEK